MSLALKLLRVWRKKACLFLKAWRDRGAGFDPSPPHSHLDLSICAF